MHDCVHYVQSHQFHTETTSCLVPDGKCASCMRATINAIFAKKFKVTQTTSNTCSYFSVANISKGISGKYCELHHGQHNTLLELPMKFHIYHEMDPELTGSAPSRCTCVQGGWKLIIRNFLKVFCAVYFCLFVCFVVVVVVVVGFSFCFVLFLFCVFVFVLFLFFCFCFPFFLFIYFFFTDNNRAAAHHCHSVL